MNNFFETKYGSTLFDGNNIIVNLTLKNLLISKRDKKIYFLKGLILIYNEFPVKQTETQNYKNIMKLCSFFCSDAINY